MGFVKTADEIARIEDELASARWTGAWLSMQFLTEPDTVRRLLPPPLRPAAEPLAAVSVGRWQSNCLGDFAGGVLNLAALHEEVEGSYVVAIYMDREAPITFGRELFGEPKKQAASAMVLDGDRAHAHVERHGVRLIELTAELGMDLGPSRMKRSTFNYKARTAADGRGLQEDAILTRTRFDVHVNVERIGTGTVTLRSSEHDPLSEVGVVEVRRAVYGEDDSDARSEAVATVPADEFLPYHYGRQDNWLALNTVRPRAVPTA